MRVTRKGKKPGISEASEGGGKEMVGAGAAKIYQM